MIQILGRTLSALAIIFFISNFASAQPQLPAPIGLVSDYDSKLSPQTRQSLENLLSNFRTRTQVEVAVAVMAHERLQGYTVEDYALRLFREWKIGMGQEKLGLLLLVAVKPPDDKGVCSGETRLEVSRHLEGDVPDGLAWEMIRKMRDDLKACRIDQGITTGAQTILATVAQRRGVSIEGVDSTQAYRPPPPRRTSKGRGISPSLIIFVIFIIFVIISALSRNNRGGPGGRRYRRGLDGAEWMLLPIIFGSNRGGFGGYRGGSDWGDSGWSGGGSGDFGGFGGGGDAGGGGASDSW